MSDEEKSSVKTPTFSGEEEDWPFFKAKLKAYVAKRKLTKLLEHKGQIAKIGKVWPTNTKQETIDEAEKLQEQNAEAAGILHQGGRKAHG